MKAKDIEAALRRHFSGELYIPEFTYGDHRIDAVIINCRHRTVRGFEIKVDKKDFLNDKKWQLYSRFLSSLSIACPAGLIEPDEVSSPFGLVWITPEGFYNIQKNAKNLQSRESLAWTWTYLSVLEKEIPRLVATSHAQVKFDEQERLRKSR